MQDTSLNHLSKSDQANQELVLIISKLLNQTPNTIEEFIYLFRNIDPHLQRCLEELVNLDRKDYVSFLMLIDYFLISKKSAKKIIEEFKV